MLDQIASDPEFRQALLDDPDGAVLAAGFGSEIDDLNAAFDEMVEVAGYTYQYQPTAQFRSAAIMMHGPVATRTSPGTDPWQGPARRIR
jgi:hypothetical protein